jgi:uncharacterized protein (DUF433 family)
MSGSEDEIDWSECPDVERVPGKVSGQWIVRDTRILADGVIENTEGGVSLEQLTTDVYANLGSERAKRIIPCARARTQVTCSSRILLDESVPIAGRYRQRLLTVACCRPQN